MATDFKLPFSAGAESSSVSFDPRRQVAGVDDEVTQVTQAGGQPALDVGSTIAKQFGEGEPTASGADAFTDGAPGSTQQDLNTKADAYVAKRKGVWGEYAAKSLKQKKLAQQATKDLINKMKDKKALDARMKKQEFSKQKAAERRYNESVQIGAQMKRRKMWSSIDEANAKHDVLHKAKVQTAQNTQVKTTDVKTTDVKDTGVKDQNLALAADPSKKPV